MDRRQPELVNDLGGQIAQMLAPIITAQNSCQIHEHCDSSCPHRTGVKTYQLMPNGERRYETDPRAALRAQMDAMSLNAGQQAGPAPMTIPPNAPMFRYQHLQRPDSMIRLLKLRGAYYRADPVDVEMIAFDIDDLPPYGALSYCWGYGLQADRRMLCNGQVFHARTSLEAALKRLRAGFSDGRTEQYLWADAICINQQDLEEKGDQIQLMETIYSMAATVYVDLGDTGGQAVSDGKLTATMGGGRGMGTHDAFGLPQDSSNPLLHKTIFQALRQPWFTRTWVIQEVALARRAIYMYSGNIFTQQQMEDALSRDAMRANPGRMQELMQSGSGNIMRNYLNYAKLQQIKNGRGRMGSLQIMELTRDFMATDPADKVFGLMALMSDEDRRDIGPYTQSVEDVYRRFAALQVRRGAAIDLINTAGLQRRSGPERRLPSWVPDWTGQNRSPKQIAGLRPVPYAASGFTKAHARMVGDESGSGGLSLRGMIVDTIDTVVHVHSAPLGPDGLPVFVTFHDTFRAAFDEFVGRGKSNYSNNEEAFARLLLMDDTYTGRNAIMQSSPIEQPAEIYHAALAAWRAGGSQGRGTGPGGKMDAVQTFQMQASTVCPGRGFATTRSEYVGLVSPVAQDGDKIAVFYGASVPYVIRRVHGGYVLVGDAFVHGLMCGEAMERWDFEVEDVVLV